MNTNQSKLTRNDALEKLHDWVKSAGLIQHCLSVETVMRTIAANHSADEESFALAGLLHDADWEIAPESHPEKIVTWVRSQNQDEIANAIAAHGTDWGKPYTTLMDKALVASDELTGLVCACAKVRPDGILGLEPKSVLKRFKTPSFAAGVDRNEIVRGLAILGVTLEDHIQTIINALKPHSTALGLGPKE